MINCVTSDCKIWNRDKFIIDLFNAKELGPVEINLNAEGPCCEQLGLNQLLESIPGLTVSAIHTSNQIQSSNFKEVRKTFVELELAKQKIKQSTATYSNLTKRFALFVGRSNWQRLALASYMWKNHNKSVSLTYHYDKSLTYHSANFGLEELLEKQWDCRHTVYEFLEQLPIKHDHQEYPILWDKNAFDLEDQYPHIFCEIVCETFFSGKTFMMTEKTMRPIIQRRPFIVQGPKFFLENLKRLGFKTFDKWWDESYDIDESDGKFGSIQWIVDYIGQQSAGTIQQWYAEMQPILEHNANTLAELTNKQIVTTEFKSS